MDNSFKEKNVYDEFNISPKSKKKSSSFKVRSKLSSFHLKKNSQIKGIRKSDAEKNIKTKNLHKVSVPDISLNDKFTKFEMRKNSVRNERREGKIKCKDGMNRKFIKKNEKKRINSIKKRREGNTTHKIKVVGIVSAKLNALIQRLEQNNANSGNANTDNANFNKHSDKVVIAPRIRAALEKFNKKKEEKPEIIRFGRIRNKRESKSNNKNNKSSVSNEEEEYEYDEEEEEEYEYEEYEEEEDEKNEKEVEEKKENSNKNLLRLSKKGKPNKKKRNNRKEGNVIEEDNTKNYNDNEYLRKKRRKKEKRDNSKGNSKMKFEVNEEDYENEENEDGNIRYNNFQRNGKLPNHRERILEFSEDKERNKNKKNVNENRDEEFNEGDEEEIINSKRSTVKHRSGHGEIIIKSASKGHYSIKVSDEETDENQKNINQNAQKIGKRLDDGDILTVKKRFVKNIEYTKFLFKHYTINNFKSKLNGKPNLKEMLKYKPSKQVNFVLYAIYDYISDEELYNEKILKGKVLSTNMEKLKNNSKDDIDEENNMKYKFTSSLKNYNINAKSIKNVALPKIYENNDNSKNIQNSYTNNYNNEDDKDDNSIKMKNIAFAKKYRNSAYSKSNKNSNNNNYNNEEDIDDNTRKIKVISLEKKYRNSNNNIDDNLRDIKNISLGEKYKNNNINYSINEIDSNTKNIKNIALPKKYKNNNTSDNNFNNQNEKYIGYNRKSQNSGNSLIINKFNNKNINNNEDDFDDNIKTFKSVAFDKKYKNNDSGKNNKNSVNNKGYIEEEYMDDDNTKKIKNISLPRKYNDNSKSNKKFVNNRKNSNEEDKIYNLKKMKNISFPKKYYNNDNLNNNTTKSNNKNINNNEKYIDGNSKNIKNILYTKNYKKPDSTKNNQSSAINNNFKNEDDIDNNLIKIKNISFTKKYNNRSENIKNCKNGVINFDINKDDANNERYINNNIKKYKNIAFKRNYKNNNNSQNFKNKYNNNNEADIDANSRRIKNIAFAKKYNNNKNYDQKEDIDFNSKTIKNVSFDKIYNEDNHKNNQYFMNNNEEDYNEEDIDDNSRKVKNIASIKKYINNNEEVIDNNSKTIKNVAFPIYKKNDISKNNKKDSSNNINNEEEDTKNIKNNLFSKSFKNNDNLKSNTNNNINNNNEEESESRDNIKIMKNIAFPKKYRKVNKKIKNNKDNMDITTKSIKNVAFSKIYNNNNDELNANNNAKKYKVSSKNYYKNNNNIENREKLKTFKNIISTPKIYKNNINDNFLSNKNDLNDNDDNTDYKCGISFKKYTNNSKTFKNFNQTLKNYNNNDMDEIDNNHVNIINSIRNYTNNTNNNMDESSINHLNIISNKNYDNSKYRNKLSYIEKMKEDLINENISINNEINKRKKKYQSIVLIYNKEFRDFSNILNENNKNDGILKNKNKKGKAKRMSVFDIIKKRGIAKNIPMNEIYENMNSSIIEKNKKVKFNSNAKKKRMKKYNKDIAIKRNNDGVNYILFTFKRDIKKFNRDEKKEKKWILEPSKSTSLFLKAIRPNRGRNKNNRIYFNVDIPKKDDKNKNDINIKNKNKTTDSLLYNYKNKGDKLKITKNFKFDDLKKFVSENEEENEESNEWNESRDSNCYENNIKNDNHNYKNNSSNQLYFDLLFNTNKQNNSEEKKSDKNIINDNNSSEYIDSKEKGNKKPKKYKRKDKRIFTKEIRGIKDKESLTYFDYKDKNKFQRKEKKGKTLEGKGLVFHYEFTSSEEKFKGHSKIKYTKAVIKKFKSYKGNFESSYYNGKKEGSLHKYLSDKNNRIKFDNNIKKLEDNSSLKRGKSYCKLKFNHKRNNKSSNRTIDYEDFDYEKYSKILFGSKNQNKIKNEKYISKGRDKKVYIDESIINNYNKKSQSQELRTINIQKSNNRNFTDLNRKEYKVNKKQYYGVTDKICNSIPNKNKMNVRIKTQSIEKKKNDKIEDKEMLGIEEIKNKFKLKLIQIEPNLSDAIDYYKGPIDISCISTKNYKETVNDLTKKMFKNRFKFLNYDNNYFKFSDGFVSFLIKVVKIKYNLFYYLVIKTQ